MISAGDFDAVAEVLLELSEKLVVVCGVLICECGFGFVSGGGEAAGRAIVACHAISPPADPESVGVAVLLKLPVGEVFVEDDVAGRNHPRGIVVEGVPGVMLEADAEMHPLARADNGSGVLAPPSLGQRRRLGRMYGSSSRPSTVGELLDRLRRATRDCCDVALDQGARQLQLTGLGDSELIEPQLGVVGLKSFADGTVPIPPVDNVGLRGEFRAAHLLTFMVISRCCSPVVQLVLKSCRERLDAGQQAWHFILSTYQVRDDLYIAQLEEKMTHIRMGEQESVTDYCNRARWILAEIRMAGAEYSTASYISHIVKGLPRSYNLMKRMMMVPGMRESLDEDSITSYILQDEAMQEAEKPTELLPQVNYAAPTKLH
ncbi:unnamed protein product [Closterium sp. NIES-54]